MGVIKVQRTKIKPRKSPGSKPPDREFREMNRRTNMTTITFGREAVRNQGFCMGPGLLGRQ